MTRGLEKDLAIIAAILMSKSVRLPKKVTKGLWKTVYAGGGVHGWREVGRRKALRGM